MTEKFDAFGFDPTLVDKTLARLDNYYRYWFRVEAGGLDNVPASGPAIFYGNHAGFNGLDYLMLQVAARRYSTAKRFLRPLFHLGMEKAPLFGRFVSQNLGGVLGHPLNAEYLLNKGSAILTYPEGGKSTGRPFKHRRLMCGREFFGKGFVKLAARCQAPMIPVATIGCEEALPVLGFSKILGRRFRFDDDLYPIFPQTFFSLVPRLAGFPIDGFHFLIAFPAKIKIKVGPAIAPPPENAVDHEWVTSYQTLEDMIQEMSHG